MRIGLISDTHIPTAGPDPSAGLRAGLWPQVYDALRGVDLIMHGGDLHDPVALDLSKGERSRGTLRRPGLSGCAGASGAVDWAYGRGYNT